jgi:hypothetical protein
MQHTDKYGSSVTVRDQLAPLQASKHQNHEHWNLLSMQNACFDPRTYEILAMGIKNNLNNTENMKVYFNGGDTNSNFTTYVCFSLCHCPFRPSLQTHDDNKSCNLT